jgi:hypothetical protein
MGLKDESSHGSMVESDSSLPSIWTIGLGERVFTSNVLVQSRIE